MRTIFWENDTVNIIDQTLLPDEFKVIQLDTVEKIGEAIYKLRVRGAPAIGVAGAYGVVTAVKNTTDKNTTAALQALESACPYLIGVRPTATNLSWAVNLMWDYAKKNGGASYDELLRILLEKATKMADHEVDASKRLSEYGASIIPKEGANISTHCSTGPLCTVDYGLNMGAVYTAMKQGKRVHVYTDETRPRLQGAKLNTYDLDRMGVPYTLIPDNHAAYLMQKGMIDMVFIGADRVASNGDTAAKIGVYSLCLAAKAHGLPVYLFCPVDTIDFSIDSGSEIVVEERDPDEVRKINGQLITLPDAPVINYCFDVTPSAYFTGIVTEVGIAYPPYKDSLRKLKELYDLEND
ncbi:MAG: S-methyl-5-thioribose-1-phosphate isomerase [Oscillospiraceae bacterium]|nr:S-methyl-5-thioribose-1-phosphate isomerase [Oscillospiraceae bacterium]